jgi:hypothetical protein
MEHFTERVWQEIHCPKSGGGCGGYILLKLNVALNCRVKIICPNCKHEHFRVIANGLMQELGRFEGQVVEDICPPLAAWSKKPRTDTMKNMLGNERDGVRININDPKIVAMTNEDAAAQCIVRQSMRERVADRM